MNRLKKRQEKVEIELNYLVGKQDVKNGIFPGGVETPKHLNELIIDVHEDESFDEELDDFVKNGKLQVTLSGSNRALEELGRYLVALTRHNTEDPSYHDHFEDIKNSVGESLLALNIRKQK